MVLLILASDQFQIGSFQERQNRGVAILREFHRRRRSIRIRHNRSLPTGFNVYFRPVNHFFYPDGVLTRSTSSSLIVSNLLYQLVEVLLVEQPRTRFNKGSTRVHLSLPRKMSRVRVSSPALRKLQLS
jgi:hypothetical protein